METEKICPNCRKPLPPDVPLGLCPECLIKSGFPTESGTGASGEAAGARFVPPSVGEIARLFPQLEILRLIGQGGMGAVYKARQPSLDRFVALKVLPPAVASDPGFAERFNREARALARLSHPNIVAVHDFGQAGPLHYLLMEFVDGANLREVERARELTSEQALAIVPQICEALQFAHNEGVVHRDIKPENLLMDKKGRVKITDFGIAKMMGIGLGSQTLTGAKDVVGTPHYMAPEQIEKPQTVDHRADIYSLGVVFYEMLTGELPLGKFAPPSKKVEVDVRLDEVVLHALEKEPARRYQHASQVKTDLETIAGTVPPAAGFAAQGVPAPLPATPSGKVTSDKAILPALLLAFPFGIFGAHRFYAGKIGTAFLQLGAFFGCIFMIIACATTGGTFQPTLGILLGFLICGCFFWAVVDWILILCKAFNDGQGRRITQWLHPQNGNLKTDTSPLTGPPSTPPPGGPVPPVGAGPQPAPLTPGKMPAAPSGMIVAPAVGLMVAALWKILSALSVVFLLSGGSGWLETKLGNFGLGTFPHWEVVPGFMILLLKMVPALFILFGAFQMLRLRSYAWAMAAAILSIVACSLIGLPIGIWALIVLARPDVRETFAQAARSESPKINVWPWALGVALATCMFILIVLAVNFAGQTSRPDAASVGTSDGSSPMESALQAPAMPTQPATPPLATSTAISAASPALPPVRIRAGSSESFVDHDGNLWLPDQGFADGEITERPDLAIVNTRDPELYRAERYGMTSFSYPVPNGKYVVKLHFAETYDAITGPGKRVFTFVVEGLEHKDFDVWTEAGGAQRACVETVNVEVNDGTLNINFIPEQQYPQINGIEILPVLPAAAAVAMPPSPKATGPPSDPPPPREKMIGNLSTTDPFWQNFNQTLPLPANGRLRLDNVNGRIRIVGGDRNEVVIKALKHGKTRESVEAVKINVTSPPDEIDIHTETPPGESGFSWSWLWSNDWRRNDATVDYAIQVPHNAHLKQISDVNGSIIIENVSGDIGASAVNGQIQVQGAAGNLKVSTVNGRIETELVSLNGSQSVSLDTVNGTIEAILPANADAEVTADTVSGGTSSDFPSLTVKKDFPIGRHLKGTLGHGGARVKLNTVNGSIGIRSNKPADTAPPVNN
jgi:TM2 domain-containing membrane protein YozV